MADDGDYMKFGDADPEPLPKLGKVEGSAEPRVYIVLLFSCLAFLIALGAIYMIFLRIQKSPSDINWEGWLVFALAIVMLFGSGNMIYGSYKDMQQSTQ